MALLEVENLQTHFRTPDGVNRAVDGVSFEVGQGEIAGNGGRERLRQIRLRPIRSCGLFPEPPGRSRGRDPFSGRRPAEARRSCDARRPRQRHQHDLPGADDEPQSSAHHRPPARETIQLHRGARQERCREACRRDADAGRHRRAAAARARISAPAVRRHAPARDDRDGACLQSQAPDRRRADHRARRDHPGADPRPDARSQTARRRRHHPDHPRSRRRRRSRRARDGDVRGPQGRGGIGRRSVSHAAPSLHAGPARRGAEAWLVGDRRGKPPRRDSRAGAEPQATHRGLRVREPLSSGGRLVP